MSLQLCLASLLCVYCACAIVRQLRFDISATSATSVAAYSASLDAETTPPKRAPGMTGAASWSGVAPEGILRCMNLLEPDVAPGVQAGRGEPGQPPAAPAANIGGDLDEAAQAELAAGGFGA